MLSARKRVGVIYVTLGEDTVAVRSGDCCKIEGRKGQYRIIGLDYHKTDKTITVSVRHEKSGRARSFDGEQIIPLTPPYRAIY